MPRLTPAKLQKAQHAVRALIAAVHDARHRYPGCRALKPGRLAGLSRCLKGCLTLPHTTDFSPFEPELKRRLIQAKHRIHGYHPRPGTARYGLAEQLPAGYQDAVQCADVQLSALLKILADVPLPGRNTGANPPSIAHAAMAAFDAQVRAVLNLYSVPSLQRKKP